MAPNQIVEREGGANQDVGSGGGGDAASEPLRDQDKVDRGAFKAEKDLTSVNKTFQLVQLRERIIDYAMRDKQGGLCGEGIGKLRLVGGSWLDTVSRLVARDNQPLYKLILTKYNSLDESRSVQVHKKLLDRFVIAVDRRIEEPFPTFRLKILEEFFQFENYDSLNACFTECGKGLVELDMKVPLNGGSLPCIFSNVDFPSLKKVTVTLTRTKLPEPSDPKATIVGNSFNVTSLLTYLFRNNSITEVEFPFHQGVEVIPVGFQFIPLPTSITALDLSCMLKDSEAEILVRSRLPCLTSLKLMVGDYLLPADLLSRILDNLRKTLRFIYFSGIVYRGPPLYINKVKFPVMERLENLKNFSVNWEPEEILSLDHTFPKLSYLTLQYHTLSMFHKWTSGICSTTVKTLELGLVDENQSSGRGFVLPLSLENMQRTHLTFPNIRSLKLKLTGRQSCGLKYMFQEMGQLEVLKLYVQETEYVADSNDWDSILVGIPEDVIGVLSAHPDLWEHFEVNKNQKLPSITMLQELHTLCLYAPVSPESVDEEDKPNLPLISDVAFEFALLKMPKLKNLDLSDRFKASEKSTEAWNKGDGRTIDYTPVMTD